MSKVGLAFVPSSFWIRGKQDNPLFDGQYPSHGTCSTKACLDIGPYPYLCWGKRLCFADGTFLSHRVCFRFVAAEARSFSPNFPRAHIHQNQCCEPSLPLLYLNGLEPSFSFVTFLC
jgi:hypothetical protein